MCESPQRARDPHNSTRFLKCPPPPNFTATTSVHRHPSDAVRGCITAAPLLAVCLAQASARMCVCMYVYSSLLFPSECGFCHKILCHIHSHSGEENVCSLTKEELIAMEQTRRAALKASRVVWRRCGAEAWPQVSSSTAQHSTAQHSTASAVPAPLQL
jgi:hypothetical protein